jgi:hypothetical protein
MRAQIAEQCFLSYAREDLASASRLCSDLTAAGVAVWFDKISLRPGERWRPAIQRAISESRYFIALLSSRSVAKRGYVQRELRDALAVLAEFPENEIYLIPTRLDDCKPPFEEMADLNWLDLFPNWAAAVSALATVIVPGRRTPSFDLRFDGLYATELSDGARYYARFFPDGYVATSNSIGSPEQVIRWIGREAPMPDGGTYVVTGSKVQFDSTNKNGTVKYEGDIEQNALVLRSHSLINGHRGVARYIFFAL